MTFSDYYGLLFAGLLFAAAGYFWLSVSRMPGKDRYHWIAVLLGLFGLLLANSTIWPFRSNGEFPGAKL